MHRQTEPLWIAALDAMFETAFFFIFLIVAFFLGETEEYFDDVTSYNKFREQNRRV